MHSRLKLRPERAYLRGIYSNATLFKCTGVRRFESERRKRIYALKSPVEEDPEHSGSYMVHPLINWTDDDVKNFLKSIHFEINENYKPYGVSGCYYCPFYEKKIYEKILRGLPNIYDGIISLEKELRQPAANGYQYIWKLKRAMLEQTELNV